MNMERFSKILIKAARKSHWISWLISDKDDTSRSNLHFLHTCVDNIPAGKHSRIFEKLDGDSNEIEATINELVTHELLRRLKLTPEFEPLVNGLTPDLSFKVLNKEFIAEVYTMHSPKKTYKTLGTKTGKSWDKGKPGESRAHKIAEELDKKAEKYNKLNKPLVVFVFLGDHHILSSNHVEEALFGMTINEVDLEKRFPLGVSRDSRPVGGIFLPYEDGKYRHSNLSAVIACDWFDSLNRNDSGKRLYCLVLRNWSGVLLPTEAFNGFPQVAWDQHQDGIWKPSLTPQRNIVAKFTNDDGLEFHPYTANSPW